MIDLRKEGSRSQKISKEDSDKGDGCVSRSCVECANSKRGGVGREAGEGGRRWGWEGKKKKDDNLFGYSEEKKQPRVKKKETVYRRTRKENAGTNGEKTRHCELRRDKEWIPIEHKEVTAHAAVVG